uniref:F-box protein SKIP23 n=1 Tax=Acorus gramineus TaxID=55184 RepID=A0AAV9AHR8_ACOGR|nr:F-box protein SKIP23 [Acorus gramineus]
MDKMKDEEQRDWSSLPEDILYVISRRLTLLDCIHLSVVCTSWHQSIKNNNNNSSRRKYTNPAKQVPWLMLPCEAADHPHGPGRSFFSLSDGGKTLHIGLPRHLANMWCVGTSDGWLFVVDSHSELIMLDPTTGAEVALPSIASRPTVTPLRNKKGNIHKYRFSWQVDGILEDWGLWRMRSFYYPKAIFCRNIDMVATIIDMGFRIAVARVGDIKWTVLETPARFMVDDIMFHEGWLYALINSGYVLSCNLLSPTLPTCWKHVGKQMRKWYGLKRYLVMSVEKELLQVFRRCDPTMRSDRARMTLGFDVFRLHENGCDWVEMTSLGDHQALFLGDNHSVSLAVDSVHGLMGNRVYFTDDDEEKIFCEPCGAHIGVYKMDDMTVEPYCSFPNKPGLSPPPVWFMPNYLQ